MAIAIVQTGTVGKFNGTLQATSVINGVTAGNMLFLLVTHFNGDSGATGGTTSCYFDVQDSAHKFLFGKRTSSNGRAAEIHYVQSATAGNHSCFSIPGAGSAANCSGQVMAVEVSGLDSSKLVDATGGVANNNNNPTATTGTLVGGNELCFAVLMGVTALTGATHPPTSAQGTFTDLYSDLTATELATIFSYSVVPASTAVATAWGTLNSVTVNAGALATFIASTAGAYTLSAGQGSYSRLGSPGILDIYLEADTKIETYTGQTATMTGINSYTMQAGLKNYARTGEPANLVYTPAASPMRTVIGAVSDNNLAGMRTNAAVFQ